MASELNMGKVIAVAGNQGFAADLARGLATEGYRIGYLLHMAPDKADSIAGYQDLSPLAAELGARLIRPATYAMTDEETPARFADVTIDLLISAGWQRLIPPWLLARLSIGAFGMHGSAEPLPRGRGRSPMVWSILEGRNRFLTNLFRYDEGVDSGLVIATQRFDIGPRDTIRSLQHKNTLAQLQLMREHLPALLAGTATLTPQPADVAPTYYPKRVPDDGVLDWHDSVERVDRLVRAVTRPYPGAFTFEGDQRINVWAGAPFDWHLRFDAAAPGAIVATFYDGTFVVQCADDTTYYVTEWDSSADWRPRVGLIFESRPNPSWDKLTDMYAAEGAHALHA